MDVSIERLDVNDDDALRAWWEVHASSQRLGREDTANVWTLAEMTVSVRDTNPRRTRILLAAHVGADIVGAATISMSNVDNLDSAGVEIDVRPDHRGAGIGSALLAAVEDVARGHTRSVLQAEVAWPYDGEPTGRGVPNMEFARAGGFTLGLVDVQRRLSLPVAPDLLDRLAAEAATHHSSYTIESWVGPVPDRLVDSWAALVATLMTEAPTGEMSREVEALDAEAVREEEARIEEQGRTKYNAVALDGSGNVVAYTDLATTVHEPGKAYQWGTLVHRAHRGHRLGIAVKVATLRLLATEQPDVTSVRTWNAEVNSPMVGVNELLGFVPVERLGEVQKRL